MKERRAILCAATIAALICFPSAARADESPNGSSPPASEPQPAPQSATETQASEERHFEPDPRMQRLLERRTTLDVNVEGGLGRVFADPAKTIGFARARVGVLLVRAPFFESLGATYEYSGLSPATFGLQAELAWSGGFWGQAGVMLDAGGHWGGMAALGYALVGVEGERRDAENTGVAWAVYGKLRLPLTILALAFGATSTSTSPP